MIYIWSSTVSLHMLLFTSDQEANSCISSANDRTGISDLSSFPMTSFRIVLKTSNRHGAVWVQTSDSVLDYFNRDNFLCVFLTMSPHLVGPPTASSVLDLSALDPGAEKDDQKAKRTSTAWNICTLLWQRSIAAHFSQCFSFAAHSFEWMNKLINKGIVYSSHTW